ncbi:helix-turn-helix domain-containing protein [Streptomyces sp. MS19]|uniref:helix-turn-helix domain-containing protein n=1 Tax=Streptomyces sp. MS19 TaxID=3385972 RepID=UPI0039A0232B
MEQRYYSMDEVAGLLGLHVRTVRGYVRDGRLRATRVGRRYRVTAEDLAAFTGTPVEPPPRRARRAEVSCVARVEAIGPDEAIRLTNTLVAAAVGRHGRENADRLRVESAYDEERGELKVIVLGGPAAAGELLGMIDLLALGEGTTDQ